MRDFNTRINWQPGMELTAATFRNMDCKLELCQQVMLSTANDMRYGLLPNMPFQFQGMFVNDVFEVLHIECTAMLASGQLISPNESATISMKPLETGLAYLVVCLDGGEKEYEKDGVPFVSPTYKYEVCTKEELEESANVFPIARFVVHDGVMELSKDYIVPCMLCSQDMRFNEWRDKLAGMLATIVSHEHLQDGDGKQSLLRCLFRLRHFNMKSLTQDFVGLLQETACSVEYYIVEALSDKTMAIPDFWGMDIEDWMKWLVQYLQGAREILDDVILEDHSLDYEKLKQEILALIQPDLQQRLEAMQLKLHDDLLGKLSSMLQEYVEVTFRKKLHDQLYTELYDELKRALYDALYKALYDVLYVPPQEEEDNFMPLI